MTPPLIVFIHVPKTAGTTVRHVLADCAPHGNYAGEHDAYLETTPDAVWIGGHIPIETMQSSVAASGRTAEYFATIREPFAHLVSNLRHCIRRIALTQGQTRTDTYEAEIDADVAATNFQSEIAVLKLLWRHRGNFLNLQSRYLLGPDYAYISPDKMIERVAQYTMIATDTRIPDIYRAFGFIGLPADALTRRDNTNDVPLDTSRLLSAALRPALADMLAHDMRLYAHVSAQAWPAVSREGFRSSARNNLVRATAENFSEHAYFAANPDVEDAVRAGIFSNGRAHFDACGHAEGRALLLPATL